jgi:soluble P-type ATPase
MLEIDVPGFGSMKVAYLVSDFNGTLALDGSLPPQVKQKLNALSESLEIFVLTSDEFGKAKEQLKDVNCTLHILRRRTWRRKKRTLSSSLEPRKLLLSATG